MKLPYNRWHVLLNILFLGLAASPLSADVTDTSVQASPEQTSKPVNSFRHKAKKRFRKKLPSREVTSEAAVIEVESKQELPVQVAAKNDAELKKRQYIVRVLLDEQSLDNHQGWRLKSNKGFFLTDVHDETKKITIPASEISLTVRNGFLYVNNKKISHKNFRILPVADHITYTDKQYQGAFFVLVKGTQVYLVNAVDMEDYLVAVVSAESWPGWPLEVNKVMAIVCRSYVIAMIQESQTRERMYHIKNTNAHQTYHGFKKDSPHRIAVQETRGMFLAHNGKPIIAMFDCCCGGIIPARVRGGIDFKSAPYLARTYACNHCKKCKLYSWQATYSTRDLETILKKDAVPRLKKLKEVSVSKKDGAGLVRELSLKGSSTHAISGKKIYSMLKSKVKSFCFTVTKKSGNFIFEGRGYGHQLGLCQWGAKQMAVDGWDYKSILLFYYPGTVMMKLAPARS